MRTYYQLFLLTAGLSLIIAGCQSQQPGWKQFKPPSANEDIDALLTEVEKLIAAADTKEKLREVIQTYERILQTDLKNREALLDLSRYCMLMAYGYPNEKEEKAEYYLKAIKYSEQLMYLNPEFKQLVDKGKDLWDACPALSQAEIEVPILNRLLNKESALL